MTDTRDTTERLREYAANAPRGWLYADDAEVFTRAADEIERLRGVMERLFDFAREEADLQIGSLLYDDVKDALAGRLGDRKQ